MRDRPSPPEIGRSVQERVAHEAEQFLMAAASAAQQRIAATRRKRRAAECNVRLRR